MSEATTIRGRSDSCTRKGGLANATASQMEHVASRCRRKATCIGAMCPRRVFVLTNERPQSAVTKVAANRGAAGFCEGAFKAGSSLVSTPSGCGQCLCQNGDIRGSHLRISE